jgi:hypothetical protein
VALKVSAGPRRPWWRPPLHPLATYNRHRSAIVATANPNVWRGLNASLWFVPSLLVGARWYRPTPWCTRTCAVLRQHVEHIGEAAPPLATEYEQTQVQQRAQEILALLG